MLVNLQVISSSKIKTSKPWPRIVWLGKDKENLMLLKSNGLRKFNPDTGQTKKTIHSIVKDCLAVTCTRNGGFVIGLLADGTVFVWYKDRESMFIVSNDGKNLPQSKPKMKAGKNLSINGNNAANRLAVVNYNGTDVKVYLWECKVWDEHDNLVDIQQQLPPEAVGTWMQVETDVGTSLLKPPNNSSSLTWDFMFVPELSCCGSSEIGVGAFVYTSELFMRLVVLYVHFNRVRREVGFAPVCKWKCTSIPLRKIDPTVESSSDTRRTYVVRWSRAGNLIAVAVNLRNSARDYVVFASQNVKSVSIIGLPEEFSNRRHHRWVCDMDWTYNDLFLVLINRLGSICLMSRLGEAITIVTYGCSMDLPQAQFLNIHPFIYVKSDLKTVDGCESSSVSETLTTDILRQRFSVSTHSRSPLFLCSDGYMVTCLCLTAESVCVYNFAGAYLKHIRKLRKRVKRVSEVSEIESDDDEAASKLSLRNHHELRNAKLEEFSPGNSDDESSRRDPAIYRCSLIGNHDSGAIVLGSHSYQRPAKESPDRLTDELRKVVRAVYSVWGLLATVTEEWTSEWEKRCNEAAEQLVKICSFLISCSDGLSQYKEVQHLIENWLNICCFDQCCKNMLPIIFKTLRRIFGRLLKRPIYDALSDCGWLFYRLLKSLENLLGLNEDRGGVCEGEELGLDVGRVKVAGNRLYPMWRSLRKWILRLNIEDENLKFAVWSKNLGDHLRKHHVFKFSYLVAGSRLLLKCPSDWKSVTNAWKVEAELIIDHQSSPSSTKKCAYLLHAVLYALLSFYQARDVTLFIFWLLTKCIGKDEQNVAVSRTINSFALFLSAYVTGERLVTFPFHRPRRLSKEPKSGHRTIELRRQLLYNCISRDPETEMHWTPDAALAILMHLGAIKEAFIMCKKLGDWKTGVLIKYAEFLATESDNCVKTLENILVDRAMAIVNDCQVISKKDELFLKDILIAGALCNVPVTQRVLDQSLTVIIETVFEAGLPLIVPPDIYLPRPPYYCPQPQLVDDDDSAEEPLLSEGIWPRNVSMTIRRFLAVLRLANCNVSSAFIYLGFLRDITKASMEVRNFHNYVWPLETTFQRLQAFSDGQSSVVDGGIFRNFCAVCFFLHARDKLNISLRLIRCENDDISYGRRLKAKDKACLDSLTWMTLLRGFVHRAGWGSDLFETAISTALESPCDRRTTCLFAELFSDVVTVPRSLDHRLKLLFDRWRESVVRVASDRRHHHRTNNKDLSESYLKQCQKVKDVNDRLSDKLGAFEDQIQFDNSSEWKPRAFEIEPQYFGFLKVFLDILFRDLPSPEDSNVEVAIGHENMNEIFNKHCLFDTSNSVFRPNSATFEQRLTADATELQSMNGSSRKISSQKPPKKSQAGLFGQSLSQQIKVPRKPSVNFSISRSCLLYLHEITPCDDDLICSKNERIRRVLLWLLQWTKRDNRTVTGLTVASYNSKINFHLSLKQIWSALQCAKRSSFTNNHFKSAIERDKIVSETEELLSTVDKISCPEMLETADENFQQSKTSEISDDFGNETEISQRKDILDSLGLNLESLNRESDNDTIASSSSEWTLDFDLDDFPIDQLPPLENVREPENAVETDCTKVDETNVSKLVEFWSKRVDDLSDTVDDISTSKELGAAELTDGDVVLTQIGQKDDNAEWKAVENVAPVNFVPLLLKLDDETNENVNKTTFLLKDDIDRLTSKRLLQSNFKSQKNLNLKMPEILLVLDETDDFPVKLDKANDFPVKLDKAKDFSIESVIPKPCFVVSRGVQTKMTSAKETATMTNNNNCVAANGTKLKNKPRRKLAIVDVSFPLIEMMPSEPKIMPNKSLETQTEDKPDAAVEMLKETGLPNEPFTSAIKLKEEVVLITEDRDFKSASNSFSSESVVNCNQSVVDPNVFKERLKQLKREGILDGSVSSENQDSGKRDQSSFENVEFRREALVQSELHRRNFRKLRFYDSEDISSGSSTKILPTHIDKVCRITEEKRAKMRQRHVKRRKEDALKLVNEVLTDQQAHLRLSFKVKRYSSQANKSGLSSKASNRSVKFSDRTTADEKSESSSGDTVSPWIVPDKVQAILAHVASPLKKNVVKKKQSSGRFADILDELSESSSDESLFDEVGCELLKEI